jgi:hypothetical protein
MRIFDYAFYSLYILYLEKEKKDKNNIISALYAIMILKVLAIFAIGILFNYALSPSFKLEDLLGISDINIKILLVIAAFIWAFINYKSYKKRLPNIIEKYRNHARNKWFKAWMLYFVALGFVLIPILIIKALKAFT